MQSFSLVHIFEKKKNPVQCKMNESQQGPLLCKFNLAQIITRLFMEKERDSEKKKYLIEILHKGFNIFI